MKLHRWGLALALAGCGLVNSNTFSYSYSFDAQEFMETLGDEKSMALVPSMGCDPAASPDPCAALVPASMLGAATLSCDAPSRMCQAVVELRLPYPLDLSMQSLPSPVVKYGADKVTVQKIAYWIMKNSTNTALPPIELYVASAAAKDELDASAKLVGTVAKLPAGSHTCADSADSAPPMAAGTQPVCDVKLDDSGAKAMASFVKDYKTPFQFIAHTRIVAHAGDPLPTGTIAFFVQPTVEFSVLQ
jgi:hypothetical protein